MSEALTKNEEAHALGSPWDKVDATLRGGLQTAVQSIVRLLAKNLRSATLYGEAVVGGFDRRVHTVHHVLVVDKVDLALLRLLAAEGLRLAKAYMSAPVVATLPYIQDSLDTFPLEWLEVQQQGVTVHGQDHFSGLVFESECIRHQCESEIKVLLMGLRNALLAATGRERAVALIEHEASDRMLRTLRGMLWLHGKRDYLPQARVLDEIEKLIGSQLSGLRAALDPAARHDWPEFDRFYAEVELLAGRAETL